MQRLGGGARVEARIEAIVCGLLKDGVRVSVLDRERGGLREERVRVVIELKKPGVAARQAFDENLTSYKHPQNGIPQLFWYSAFLIASNGTDSRVGTITADWERFFEWQRIEREDEPRRVSLEVMLRATCAST